MHVGSPSPPRLNDSLAFIRALETKQNQQREVHRVKSMGKQMQASRWSHTGRT